MAEGKKHSRTLSSKGFFAFEDLEVYHLSARLTSQIYCLSQRLPASERYGLADQLRRASTSIPLTIAEGRGRTTDKDFARFLVQARGSVYEVVAALHLCVELGFVDQADTEEMREQLRVVCAKLSPLARRLGSA